MSSKAPAWKVALKWDLAMTGHKWQMSQKPGEAVDEVFEATLPHIKAAEQRGRAETVGTYTRNLKADWSRYRGHVLEEAWKALRDSPNGPLILAMQVLNDLMENPQ